MALVNSDADAAAAHHVNCDMDAAAAHHSWLMHVKEGMENDELGATAKDSDVCIFGIAHPLLRLNPEAYIPQVISLGPYHYGRLQRYKEMDIFKLKMVHAMETKLDGFRLSMLVGRIKGCDGKIRAYYHKHIPYTEEILSLMLALDACFILHFLKSSYLPFSGDPRNLESETRLLRLDRILDSKRKTPLWYAIKNDILMLENQVPMFLLIEALCLTASYIQSDTQAASSSQREIRQVNGLFQEWEHLAVILQAACSYFNPFVREKNDVPLPLEMDATTHLLGYLYHFVTAASPTPTPRKPLSQASRNMLSFFRKKPLKKMLPIPGKGSIQAFIHMFMKMVSATTGRNLPSATELSEAGIKFAPYDSGDLGHICFKRKTYTFLLPKITINDSTEVVLRNLVALELNLEVHQKPLAHYTYLMDRLIDTEKDVAVLKRNGILNSQMSSDAEVAQMWNGMSKLIWENKFDPIETAIEEANKYYRSKWRVLLAEFRKNHCSKPWLVISVLSGGFLLLLTAVQVFCLFYTCNKQSALH